MGTHPHGKSLLQFESFSAFLYPHRDIEMHLPVRTILSSHTLRCLSPCVSVVQVRGAKQKFGGLTRDPYRTLKKKLVLEKSHKVSKVPLMSSERRDNIMEFPINRTSAGISTTF